jgi:sugar phosphate isomerase/epimerase
MKISFSSFTCPSWDLSQIISAASEYGYHGIDLRVDASHGHGVEIDTTPEKRAALREEIRTSGVEPICLSTGIQLIHPDALELIQSRLKLAADLKFKAVRVLCGHPEDPMTSAEIIDLVAPRLKQAAVLAERQHLELWIETHDEMSRGKTLAALLSEVSHENAGVVYNTLHPYRMGEPVEETLTTLGKRIAYVRFHDGLKDPDKVVVCPMGRGHLPLDKIFTGLMAVPYNGYLCAEWFHEQYGTSPVETLKLYYKEITRLIDNHGAALDFMV